VDVTGVKTLRLAVAGAPSISGAWCVWGGAVLSKSGDVSEVGFYKELNFDVTAPETEAPTEPETTPDTETPTEPETAVTYPETHQAETIPVTEDSTEDDTLQEVDPPEKGCGSALVGVSTLAVTAAALTLRKRKED
jgi:hypothetical protein